MGLIEDKRERERERERMIEKEKRRKREKEFMSIVCSAEKLVAAANHGTWTVKHGEKPRSGNLSTATERFCPPARPKIGQFPSHRGFAREFSSTSLA